MTDCPICATPFTTALRPRVVCQHCKFECCRPCYQKYVIERMEKECMNPACKQIHTMAFFISNTTKTFFSTEWRDLMKTKLFDTERAQFVQTQEFIRREKVLRERIEELSTQITTLKHERSQCYRDMNTLRFNLEHGPNNNNNTAATVEDESKWNRTAFPCSNGECRGIATNYYCSLCDAKYCDKCRILLTESTTTDHVCDKDALATVEMLKHDTRPCPKCATAIHKISGCDQMFCMQCHTAFSWSTGSTDIPVMHNPHFFEWIQKTGGADAEHRYMQQLYCQQDRLPGAYEFTNTLLGSISETQLGDLLTIYRCVEHVRSVLLWECRNAQRERSSMALRVEYLENKIDKARFLTVLRSRQKRREEAAELQGLYEPLGAVTRDILLEFYNEIIPIIHEPQSIKLPLVLSTLARVAEVAQRANEALDLHSKQWSKKMPRFNDFLVLKY